MFWDDKGLFTLSKTPTFKKFVFFYTKLKKRLYFKRTRRETFLESGPKNRDGARVPTIYEAFVASFFSRLHFLHEKKLPQKVVLI